MLGSEPPPGAGSVIAKDERTLPSTMGFSHFSFCAGVPSFFSTFMLPSSGAMQLSASGPNSERAASSYITAQATIRSEPFFLLRRRAELFQHVHVAVVGRHAIERQRPEQRARRFLVHHRPGHHQIGAIFPSAPACRAFSARSCCRRRAPCN